MDNLKSKQVVIAIDGEGGTFYIKVDRKVAKKARKLMKKGVKVGEWPEKVNAIIDSAERIDIFGTIVTAGDGWGWFRPEEVYS